MPAGRGETPVPGLTDLSDDEQLLRDTVRRFARTVLQPQVRDMETQGQIPRALIDELFALGVMAIGVPEALGGSGGTFFHAVIAVEELSRVDPSIGVLVDVQTTLVINAIQRWAAPALADPLLRSLAGGRVGAYALSEASAGSDAFALETRARERPGGYVLSGRKQWITNAAEADLFIVFATVDPAAGRHGITAFVLDRATPGLSVGRREHKLGIRASSTCELVLDNCPVDASRVLGPVGQGYKVAIETLNEGRIGIGAQMVGLAAGALAAAVEYTRTRRQFGRAIAEFQGVQFQLARAAMELEAARLLVYNAARLRDRGSNVAAESAMCKLFASETAERIASLAVNLHGGNGFVTDFPIEKFYRDAKVGQIYEGTSNLQLMTIFKNL